MKNFGLILTLVLLGACATPHVGPMPNVVPAKHSTDLARKHVKDTRTHIQAGQHGLEAVDQDLKSLLQ